MAVTQIRGANNGTGTSQIKAGTISNADIHASAAIASTKLASWAADRNAGGFKLTNLGTPSSGTDAATKAYVDGVAAGFDFKESVKVATTQILDSEASISGSPSYNNTGGSSSRGQITATLAVSNTFSVDGVSLSSTNNGARILVKNEGDGSGLGGDANGIYTLTISGTSLTLDRATDFDSSAEVTSGAFIVVEEGTTNADLIFILTTNNPITLGGSSSPTALTFTAFNPVVTAGAGLTQSGNTLNVVSGNTAIVVNANDITLTLATGSGLDISSGLRIAAAAAGAGLTGGAGSALAIDVTGEVPSGTVNGSNAAFTLSATPVAASLHVYLNGQFMKPGGEDYTLSGTTVTFTNAPQTGDVIYALYFKA